MVYIKALGEELTDVEMYTLENPAVLIGAALTVQDTTYTLFDKSDVLINKIEKLPVLRNIDVDFHPEANLIDNMIASAGETLTIEVYIFNASDSSDGETMVFTKSWMYSNVSSGAAIYVSPNTPKSCAILLTDQITIEVVTTLDDTVAGANFAAGNMDIRVNLDIDWVPVTPAELKEYALEQLYVNM